MKYSAMIKVNQQKKGGHLKKLREECHLTQQKLSQMVGITERRLSAWENGKAKPSLENAAALARSLNISLKSLFDAFEIDVDGIPDDLPDEV